MLHRLVIVVVRTVMKLQAPRPKPQRNIKLQCSEASPCKQTGTWSFSGTWIFELGASGCLALLQLMLISGIQATEPSQVIPYPSFPDLASVPKDLETPKVTKGEPAPGRRVRQAGPGYDSTEVHHTLYLPVNWNQTNLYPVIVEYPGNAYAGFNGDSCSGTVEGSNLGYGISGGSNYIWLCLPFVETVRGHKQNATRWWGDINETVAYCTNTVPLVCRRF